MANFVHGDTPRVNGRTTMTSEYRTWLSMKNRCENVNNPSYTSYGGRGIKVCRRWRVYAAFLEDMGRRPSAQYSIDRINNNLNYTPSNCRWATKEEQQRNRRSTKLSVCTVAEIRRVYVPWSHTHNLAVLAKKYGVSPAMIRFVIHNKNWRVT